MSFLFTAINVARIVIIVDALSSWFLDAEQPPRSLTNALLDPLYAPVRAVLGPITGSLDLAPLVALIALQLLDHGLRRGGFRP